MILRSHGSGMHLIAICSKHAERAVGEALAQARYALALRGVAISCRTQAEASL